MVALSLGGHSGATISVPSIGISDASGCVRARLVAGVRFPAHLTANHSTRRPRQRPKLRTRLSPKLSDRPPNIIHDPRDPTHWQKHGLSPTLGSSREKGRVSDGVVTFGGLCERPPRPLLRARRPGNPPNPADPTTPPTITSTDDQSEKRLLRISSFSDPNSR